MLPSIHESARDYPPAADFLQKSLELLGKKFIANKPAHATSLMNLMIANPSDVRAVYLYFTPHAVPSSFADMYHSIWRALDTLGLENTVLILGQFDVAKWMAGNPSPTFQQEFLHLLHKIFDKMGTLEPSNPLVRKISHNSLSHVPGIYWRLLL